MEVTTDEFERLRAEYVAEKEALIAEQPAPFRPLWALAFSPALSEWLRARGVEPAEAPMDPRLAEYLAFRTEAMTDAGENADARPGIEQFFMSFTDWLETSEAYERHRLTKKQNSGGKPRRGKK